MPRIKRWFPVSHDINGDPEVWELTDRFGERALRVWLEILSISDRNEGEIKGQRESLATALSSKCRTTKTRVLQILEFAESHMWMVSDPVLRVRNREKYLPRRVQKEHPQGSTTSSPLPSPPRSVPSRPVPKKESSPDGDEAAASLGGRNGFASWPPEWEPIKARIQTMPFLTRYAHWLQDLPYWQSEDEQFRGVPATLDDLLTAAAGFCERDGYVPRSKRGIRKKLHNCMEFEARRVEREKQRQG